MRTSFLFCSSQNDPIWRLPPGLGTLSQNAWLQATVELRSDTTREAKDYKVPPGFYFFSSNNYQFRNVLSSL
ncbi:unnamed protein product [Protopolystoma xenopodis]|uniref:Uncharacterized protein n=1 Tax=Protopolystoma xenopodis TaxID=117903 RepID=A0A3S5B058_9PLAT|nr:unnamed protein product [Protopolystoma xenopodis]